MSEDYETYGDCLDGWVQEKRADEDNVEREPKFYASSFGLCHRQMVMRRAGVEGTPMSVDSMRNLEERSILHDARLRQLLSKGALIAADTGTPYAREAAPTRLSDAFPEGFGCRADGIGHVRCHCQRETFPLKVHWGKMARLYKIPGMEGKAEQSRRQLVKHTLDVLEYKTAHANLLNYSSTLPRPHNVLQVRAASWAIRKLFHLETTPVLMYGAVGSGARPLEYQCGGGSEDDYADVEREITSLQQEWKEFQEEGYLPPILPLATKDKKEGPNRVVFLVQDWQCSELYCPYAGNVCTPNMTVNQTGDRLGYREEDGSMTGVEKWYSKVPGWDKVGMAQTIDKPRTKEE